MRPGKNLWAVLFDTSEQFFDGVVDIGNKFEAFWLFLTGINNTREQFYPRCH
jgi:hypothetical protein